MKPKGFANLIIIIATLVALSAIASTYLVLEHQKIKVISEGRFCTMEAKQCPDGSYVERGGPNCQFASCPTVTTQPQDMAALVRSVCIKPGGNLLVAGGFEPGGIDVLVNKGVPPERLMGSLVKFGRQLTKGEAEDVTIDKSVVFIDYKGKKPVSLLDEFKKIFSGSDLVESRLTNFIIYDDIAYDSSSVYFKRLLTTEEQNKFNTMLAILKTKSLIDSYSWNYSPATLHVSLQVSVGTEDATIEKLKGESIFSCVSKRLNLIPWMPSVPSGIPPPPVAP